jgi:hypothetical protein
MKGMIQSGEILAHAGELTHRRHAAGARKMTLQAQQDSPS